MEDYHKRNARGKLPLDLSVALALFCGAVGSTAWFGTIVARLEQPRNVLVERIPIGTSQAFFLQDKICFGDVSTELSAGQNAFLRAHASVRTALNGRPNDVTGRLFLHFNPLGQLVRGEASVTASDVTGTIAVTGVTPLKLTLGATIGGHTLSRELAVPGPVSLIKNDANSFRLEYARLPLGFDNPATQALRRLVDGQLTVITSAAPPPACDSIAPGRFDVGELSSKLAPLIGALNERRGSP